MDTNQLRQELSALQTSKMSRIDLDSEDSDSDYDDEPMAAKPSRSAKPKAKRKVSEQSKAKGKLKVSEAATTTAGGKCTRSSNRDRNAPNYFDSETDGLNDQGRKSKRTKVVL